MSEQRHRKTVSDVSSEIGRYSGAPEALSTIDEVVEAECECCGLKEDCTHDYFSKVKGHFFGAWVCGLCGEAVKETVLQAPETTMQEAVSTHREFCQGYNDTRLNPKLSLTLSLRNIAKRSCDMRNGKICTKLTRSSSCAPRIGLDRIG